MWPGFVELLSLLHAAAMTTTAQTQVAARTRESSDVRPLAKSYSLATSARFGFT
jgi:hypothetical protein